CYSTTQADEIQGYVDCVIGMSREIGDRAAIAFTSSFYQALAFGKSLAAAFAFGRNEIALRNLQGNDSPRMLARDGVDPARIVLPGPRAPSARRVVQLGGWALALVATAAVAFGGLVAWRAVFSREPQWGFWRVEIDLRGDRFARGTPLDLKVRADHK